MDFINNLSMPTLIISIALLMLIALIIPYLISLKVQKIYRITSSPDKAIDKLRIYNTYIFGGLSIIIFILIMFLLMPLMSYLGYDKMSVCMGVFLLLVVVVSVLAEMIQHKTIQSIRGTSQKTNNKLTDTIKMVLFTLIPMFLFFIVVDFATNFLSDNNQIPEILEGAIILVIPILFIVSLNLLMPLLYPILLKASLLEDCELRSELETFIKNNDFKNILIYKWPTRDKKLANALVCGLLKKRIFISDYLIDNMNTDEIRSILAHEIGHVKKKHSLKRMLMLIIGFILFVGLIFSTISLSSYLEFDIPGPVIFILLLSFVALYFVFLTKYLYRRHETQADIFAIESGSSPDVFATALIKLAELNHIGKHLNRADEKFQTHPSMIKRIKTIEEKYSVDLNHIIS